MNPVHHIIEQNSEKWYAIRKGKITASAVSQICGVRGIGKMADTLAKQIAYETVTNFETERFDTEDTERGHELEPVARALYEDISGNIVEDGGFWTLGDDMGVSPDGLINDDGLVEIKCPAYKAHMDVLRSKKIDPKYIPQVQYQLRVTKRKWCDFVSYCEKMPKGKQIIIVRVLPDPKMQKMFEERLPVFRKMIADWIKILTT